MSDIYENNTEESVVDKRAPREVDERKDDTRPSDNFVPQSLLPTPIPQDGWVFRWVRTQILGESDNINVSTRFREGWEPVLSEDHPELKIQSDYGSEFAKKGNIEIGGLLLCKASKKAMDGRSDYYQKMAQTQMEGVDRNYLRENDPRMPLLNPERNTKVKFGGNT